MSRASLSAQTISSQEQSAQSGAIPTFHMETNLVQIPVLVLTPELKKLPAPIASNRFSISFNNDPPFRPMYARIEGDDPIHLAIVLDARSQMEDLLPKIDSTIAGLAPSFLHLDDRVSIYMMSCGEMREVRDVPGDPLQLKNAVDAALSSWRARRQLRKAPPCSSNAPLWDDLAYVTNTLAKQSGWRAILAVTDGSDRNSKHSSDDVTKMAQNAQITIFSLDPYHDSFGNRLATDVSVNQPSAGMRGLLQPPQLQPTYSNLSTDVGVTRLLALCELTGGVRLSLYNDSVTRRMQQVTQMMRGRYVLEFRRPPNAEAGDALLTVKVNGMKAFIRPAGDLIPIAKQGLVADSNLLSAVSTAVSQPSANPAFPALSDVAPPADQQPAPAQPDAIPVFHVDTIRMQLPVLVLTPELKKVSSPIAANQFSISFNKVSPFHPRNARIEGDEPLHLAVVLDARSMEDEQLTKIDGTIAGLAPSFLHPKDRISIYVMSCGELTQVRDVPGEPLQLKGAVDVALSSWTARRQLRKAPPCTSDSPLWDVLANVTNTFAKQSGWRAIIAVSDGKDVKSKHSSDDVAKMAQSAQVTILGLDPVRAGSSPNHFHSAGNELTVTGLSSTINDVTVTGLSAVCELSGGVRLSIYASSIAEQMRQLTQMLRNRYILEFPIPQNAKAGFNVLHVDVEGMRVFIRPAGDGVGAADGGPDTYSNQIPDAAIAASQPPADQQPAPAQSAAAEPAVAPAPTQQQANTPEASSSYSAPLLKVTSELTVEDVTVMDQRGMHVHGLQRSDFEVKADGQPQTITNFEEYGTERPAEQAGTPQSTPNVFSNAQPQAPTTGAVNVLLLDNVATGLVDRLVATPENLEVARQKSMKYLNKMPTGTQVAILQLSSTVRVLQGFTADKAVLLAAMKAASFKQAAGAYGETANRLRAPYDSRRDRQVLCDAANVQSELTVNGLKAVAGYLSGVKGRKNLIWFTPGIPWLTNYSQFKAEGCLVDHTQELRRVYALLSEAQVALYPIDPRGMVADNALSAVDSSIQVGGMMESRQMPIRMANQEKAFNAGSTEEHDSLRAMADATGGVPYFNRNDLDAAMQEAIETGADYYSLSYLPPLSGQVGKYHTIDVKVDRPGLRLQYRPGYNSVDAAAPMQPSADASPEASIERELLSGMVHGQAPSTQLLFDVGVTPSTDPAKPGDPQVIGSLNPTVKHLHLVRYDLAFSLAPDQVSLLEAPDGRRKGSVEFGLAAYDGEGKLLNSIQKTVKFTVSPREGAQFLQRPLRVPLKFDLPSGSIFVRVGVMDLVSQKMGTLEIPETVAK